MALSADQVDDNLQAIVKEIEEEDGLLAIRMEDVRDACGYGKLRDNVVAAIAQALSRNGIGYLPPHERLPKNQNAEVRLYRTDSQLGRVVEAIMTTAPTAAHNKLLRTIDQGEDSDAEILDQIRALVSS